MLGSLGIGPQRVEPGQGVAAWAWSSEDSIAGTSTAADPFGVIPRES